MKGTDDFLVLVYRDLDTDEKSYQIITKPKYHFYIAKEGIDIPHHLSFIERDKVEEVECYYHSRFWVIAKLAGMESQFNQCISNGQFKLLEKFNTINWVFQSDIDIEDYYKRQWIEEHPITKQKLTKSFFDIEVDSSIIFGFPDPNEAKCPVNIITYINAETRTSHTFILNDPSNPQVEEFYTNRKKFIKSIKNEYNEYLDDVKLYFFDDELELIKGFFNQVNEDRPDFCEAWNIGFDIVTLENRIMKLGGNKEEIICHPDFPSSIKTCFFQKDFRNEKIAEKSDYYQCTSYTYYCDQMITYASLRKANGELRSHKLQDIAMLENIGVGKIDYSEVSNIRDLPKDNFDLFVRYNIRDVICQYLIELKVEDINQLFDLAYMTKTRLHKVLRKTVSLKNLYVSYCNNDFNLVVGNNINLSHLRSTAIAAVAGQEELEAERNNGDDEDGDTTSDFLGAFVADPALNDYVGVNLLGKKSKWIFDNCIDEDLASLYPTIIMTNNIEASTQHGRYMLGMEAPNKLLDRGGDFIDNIQCKDLLSLGIQYFNLPTLAELIERMEGEDE